MRKIKRAIRKYLGMFLIVFGFSLMSFNVTITGAAIGVSQVFNWLFFVGLLSFISGGLLVGMSERKEEWRDLEKFIFGSVPRETSVDREAIRNSKPGVPVGTFHAPDFYVKRDTNHGEGYHCHLYRTKDDARTTIRICYDSRNVYIEEHGQGVPISSSKAAQFVENNSLEDIKRLLGSFNEKDLAKPTKKARVIKI